MKIVSWNVNGLRSLIRKNALIPFLEAENPDIVCLQEIKSTPEQVQFDLLHKKFFEKNGYKYMSWNPAKRAGYSGTAIISKVNGIFDNVLPPFESNDSYGVVSDEGRILTLEFPKFYLVNVYTPNSKPDLSRLSLREEDWDPKFLNYLRELDSKKPVISCGDFNVAHEEIDIARPKENTRSAGFTVEERLGADNITKYFVDSFRLLHPDDIKYSWWSMRGGARQRGVGWRIDYFFVSKKLVLNIKRADVLDQYYGSDHCPILLEVEF